MAPALTPLALRTLAAACCCSLSSGWLIGIWGGVTAMPAFSSTFFPQQHSSSGHHSSSTTFCIFSDQVLSLTGSVIYLSALPALAVAAHVTHRYGRKPTMWAIVALIIAGTAAGAAAQNLATVFASRALLGMAMGCCFQAPTMLLCEVLPREQRGRGMYCYNLAMAAGFLAAAIANMVLHNPPWGWRASVALLAAPAVGLAALLPAISESPQVLLQRGQPEAAARALQAMRAPGKDLQQELQQMAAAASRASSAPSGQRRIRVLLSQHRPELVASVLYPLVLMLSGLNVLSTWTPNLLLALGSSSEFALRSNSLMMAVGLLAALPGMFVVERVGRRTLLAVGGAIIAASLTALAVLVATLPSGGSAGASPALLPAAVVLLCVNRVVLTATLQPLAAAVPAEIQPLQVRSAFSSLTTCVRNSSSWVVTQFALPLLCATRFGLFLIFAACTAVGVMALWLLVPETRGLALEEVHLAWETHWLWAKHAAKLPVAAVSSSAPGSAAAASNAAGDGASTAAQHVDCGTGVGDKASSCGGPQVVEVVVADSRSIGAAARPPSSDISKCEEDAAEDGSPSHPSLIAGDAKPADAIH